MAPVQALSQVPSGFAAVLALRPSPLLAEVKSVSTSLSLARRGLGLPQAKRAVEEAIETGRAVIKVPKVEDIITLTAELRDSGMLVSRMDSTKVDVKMVREQLRMTQKQFALKYGFDLGTLRNWEFGKRKPPIAVNSCLKVISRMPDHVSDALEADTTAALQQEP